MHREANRIQGAARKAALRQKELREAIALAITSLASDDHEVHSIREAAKEACLRIESAVLASDAGPLGFSLLETLDSRLRETLGDHDLLEGRYA